MEEAVGRPIGILADLQGPKLRVGKFANGKETLKPGQTFTLDDSQEPGTSTRVYLPHPEILRSVEPGDRLLIDDGKLELKAVTCDGKSIVTTVVAGTSISDKKGVSLPDTELPVGALTEKDRADLDAVLETGVDWVALSFIQRPDDLAEARKIARGRALLMSKIEKPQAVARLAEIIELSDALMVARGDLGVEMPLEAVPGIQKQITRAARRAGKPVVVATQMLESMITAPVPTRAEVSDVSIAVFEGADAIMLSAESAAGAYPVEAVAMMNRIAVRVEQDPTYSGIINAQRSEPEATGADAISLAAREIAETLKLVGDRDLHGVRHDRPARRARAAASADHRAVADPQHGAAAVASVGHALRRVARRRRPRRHGRPRLPHRARKRISARRAIASSSPPACRCGRRVRPTCCASPISAWTRVRSTPNAASSPRRKLLGSARRGLVDTDSGAEAVAGNSRFDRACQRLKIARLAAELLDRRDDKVRRDPVGLVAEVLHPDEFGTWNVARQAERVDFLVDDGVGVAGDNDGRRRDLLVARRVGQRETVEALDIGGIGAERPRPQHQRNLRFGQIVFRHRVRREDAGRRRTDARRARWAGDGLGKQPAEHGNRGQMIVPGRSAAGPRMGSGGEEY